LITKWAETPDGREDLRAWLDFDSILDLTDLPKSAEVIDPQGGAAGGGVDQNTLDELMRNIRQRNGNAQPASSTS